MTTPVVRPTLLDELRRRFAAGELGLPEYEARRRALEAAGRAHDPVR